MGGRYLLSGVQLVYIGMLIHDKRYKEADEMIRKIMNEQYLYESEETLEKDLEEILILIKGVGR